MSRSATSSERARRVLCAAAWVAVLAAGRPVHSQELTPEEALRLAFPAGAAVERRTAYLDEAQLAETRKQAGAGVEVAQRVVSYYVAVRNGRAEAVAYFDRHRVRTLPELLMVVVTPDARVRRVEVLRFSEPPEYRAPERWLDQLEGKALGPGLSVRRDIVNLTGATLTAGAVTAAVRRVLALHAVIRPFGS